MKPLLVFVLLLLFTGAQGFSPHKGRRGPYVLFINPLPVARVDEGVLLTREALVSSARPCARGLLPLFRLADGTVLASQADDLDHDGQWDEVFLLLNLGPNDTLKCVTEYVDADELPVLTPRTNIRFARKPESEQSEYIEIHEATRLETADNTITQRNFQMEGPAWENDRVAFRNYFDARNGMDIFGKRVTEMVLDGVGYKGQDYHTLANWGIDVLKVGNSLGAGSIAILLNDSLYRIGPGSTGSYLLVCEGPLRSVFRLTFENQAIGSQIVTVQHDVSVQAGTRCYQNTLRVNDMPEGALLVSGIVNLHSDTAHTNSHGRYVSLSTHARQSESGQGEMLGMGILAHQSDWVKNEKAPTSGTGITHTDYMALRYRNGLSFWFFSAWEYENPAFARYSAFRDEMQQYAVRLEAPVKVEVVKKLSR